MNKEEWIDRVGSSFARTMPDEFPEGFAYWLARQRADAGAYDAYIRGDFEEGSLYEPGGSWSE